MNMDLNETVNFFFIQTLSGTTAAHSIRTEAFVTFYEMGGLCRCCHTPIPAESNDVLYSVCKSTSLCSIVFSEFNECQQLTEACSRTLVYYMYVGSTSIKALRFLNTSIKVDKG